MRATPGSLAAEYARFDAHQRQLYHALDRVDDARSRRSSLVNEYRALADLVDCVTEDRAAVYDHRMAEIPGLLRAAEADLASAEAALAEIEKEDFNA